MKISLIITFVIVFMFSIAGTAFAANRNFDDVPLTDWTYGAVKQLLQAGVIDSYDDKTFKGEKIVTRYEMALIIRRAIAKSEKNKKVDIEMKALINKMAAEYDNELKDLGVGVVAQPALQDKKAGVIDWSGSNFRVRYDHKATTTKAGTATAASLPKDFNYNFELVGHSEFAPGWIAEVRLEGNKDSNGVIDPAADNLSGQFDIEQMFVTGPVGSGYLTFGRFKNAPVFALVNKEFGEGVRYSFGKVVKTNITWAKNDSKYTYVNTVASAVNAGLAGESSLNPGYGTNVGTIDFKYSLDKTTDLFAAFYFTNSYNSNYKSGRIFEGAFAKKLTPDVTLRGDYAQSNRSDNNHAYYASISYKKADIATVGSYGWILEGVRNEAKATIKTDPDIKDYAYDSNNTRLLTNSGETLSGITNGQKGFDIVYQYVPVKNTKFTGRYLYAKPINGSSYDHKTQIRLQLEVFFN